MNPLFTERVVRFLKEFGDSTLSSCKISENSGNNGCTSLTGVQAICRSERGIYRHPAKDYKCSLILSILYSSFHFHTIPPFRPSTIFTNLTFKSRFSRTTSKETKRKKKRNIIPLINLLPPIVIVLKIFLFFF